MQKITPIFLSSIITAVICFALFKYWEEPDIYYINESPAAIPATDFDINMSGVLREHFNSSEPTDFIKASEIGRKSSVYIRAIPKSKTKRLLGASSGSGVIISPDGYIATNNHVVDGAEEIEVLLGNNREYSANVIGVDPSNDLALLKIEAENLNYAVFSNSDSLQVGEWVMAVGNPFGLQFTVTAGIVSAKARNISMLENSGIESFIQTDAAVNPGNSGGALINTKGEVVGINSAIMAKSGNYEGYSFAIPSNLAQKILYDIKNYGAVQRGWLGISMTDINDKKAKELNLNNVQGVYIVSVNKDGAAYDAGLEGGDVIVAVNGNSFNSTPLFMEMIGRFRPGDEVEIEYIRDERKYTTIAILRNQLNTTDFVAVRKDKTLTELGFELRELSEDEQKKLREKGVYVVSVYRNSIIGKTNMDPGYIITKINNKRVVSVTEVLNLLDEAKGQIILEGYYEHHPDYFPYVFYKNGNE